LFFKVFLLSKNEAILLKESSGALKEEYGSFKGKDACLLILR